MSTKTDKVLKKIHRQLAMQAGYYDGRFKTKVVADKKKKLSKEYCRTNKVKKDLDY